MSSLERRPYGWERRAVVAGTRSHPIIRGTAIVFNERSHDLGGFVEIITPQAIRTTLDDPRSDLRAFFDHNPGQVLGRQSAGTLKVEADRFGLHVEIDPPQPTEPPNLMQSIERGDITGMSFSFRALDDDWRKEGGQIVRYVKDMRVYEVSVVSMPAYEATDVEVALRAFRQFRATVAPTIADRLARAEARAAAWR